MPFRSNLSLEKTGLFTFPANKTFLQLYSLKIEIILPNCPIETEWAFLYFLNFFLFFKSIIN